MWTLRCLWDVSYSAWCFDCLYIIRGTLRTKGFHRCVQAVGSLQLFWVRFEWMDGKTWCCPIHVWEHCDTPQTIHAPRLRPSLILDQSEELRRQNAELTAQCKSQTATPPNPPRDKSCTAVVEVVRLALSRVGLQLVFALFYRMFGHHLQGMLRFRISLRWHIYIIVLCLTIHFVNNL